MKHLPRTLYVFKHPARRGPLDSCSLKTHMTTVALAPTEYRELAEMCGSETALHAIARSISRKLSAPPLPVTWSAAVRRALRRAAQRELLAQQQHAAELNAEYEQL